MQNYKQSLAAYLLRGSIYFVVKTFAISVFRIAHP